MFDSDDPDAQRFLHDKRAESWDTEKRRELLQQAKKEAEKQKAVRENTKQMKQKLSAERQKQLKDQIAKEGVQTADQKMKVESMIKEREMEQAAQKAQGQTEQPTQAL